MCNILYKNNGNLFCQKMKKILQMKVHVIGKLTKIILKNNSNQSNP